MGYDERKRAEKGRYKYGIMLVVAMIALVIGMFCYLSKKDVHRGYIGETSRETNTEVIMEAEMSYEMGSVDEVVEDVLGEHYLVNISDDITDEEKVINYVATLVENIMNGEYESLKTDLAVELLEEFGYVCNDNFEEYNKYLDTLQEIFLRYDRVYVAWGDKYTDSYIVPVYCVNQKQDAEELVYDMEHKEVFYFDVEKSDLRESGYVMTPFPSGYIDSMYYEIGFVAKNDKEESQEGNLTGPYGGYETKDEYAFWLAVDFYVGSGMDIKEAEELVRSQWVPIED